MAPTTKLDNLQEIIGGIFDQAQSSVASHRKNCVALYKHHAQAATITQSSKDGAAIKLIGEKAFGDVFCELVSRVLIVKKGPTTADRIVKFIGAYIKYMNEKVSEKMAKQLPTASTSNLTHDTDDDSDTMASRFIARLLTWLIQGFNAKNKIPRFRSTQIVSEMIAHLGEIDEETYTTLRSALKARIFDKESPIRIHSVIALSKLVGSEDPRELEVGEQSIIELLLEVLVYDPAAEVRRAALLNIPLTSSTVSAILSRTRDTDSITRKLVYSSILNAKLQNPRHLTIDQREQVVKDGLGDREPAVRLAASKMVGAWFDAIHAEGKAAEEGAWVGDDGGIMTALVAFLNLFDIVGPGEAIAIDALLSIFVTRPEILDVFRFDDSFWNQLTPESAVLVRVFVEHCISIQNDACLESASLPVVTAFAFHIQEAYNSLLTLMHEEEEHELARNEAYNEEDEDESAARAEDMANGAIVFGELLRIATKLDYSDEIGRRKIFAVIRDMLAQEHLPERLIDRSLDVLKEILPNERELIRVTVEVVLDLRDNDDNANVLEDSNTTVDEDNQSERGQTTTRKERSLLRTKSRDQMTPEELLKEDMIDMRCLTLCIAMLERVDGPFESNSTLQGILGDLIIPAVKRKELAMREKGLVSLGLCCLIARDMALSSFPLFFSQVQSAPDTLRFKVLQVILDLLIMYKQDFFSRSEENAERIITFFLQLMEHEQANDVLAMLCIGVCKLLLAGIITDLRILTQLVMVYISPSTADNLELRQCLSYFFPVYCYSSLANQTRMQSIFMPVLDLLFDEDEEDQESFSPYQLGLLMIDWTDSRKAVTTDRDPAAHVSLFPHVTLAIDILKALYDSERSPEIRKTLCQLLGQLHLPPSLDSRLLLKLRILLVHLEEQCPFENVAISKIMSRFKSKFSKTYSKDLERIVEQAYTDDEEIIELHTFIGVDGSADVGTGDHRAWARGPSHDNDNDAGGQLSRTQTPAIPEDLESDASVLSTLTSSTAPARKPTQAKSKPAARKTKAKKADETDSDVEKENSPTPQPVTPLKKSSKRLRSPGLKKVLASPAVKKRGRVKGPKKPAKTIKGDDPFLEDEEEEEVPRGGPSTPPKRNPRRASRKAPVVEQSDDDETDSEGEVNRTLNQIVDEDSSDELAQSSDGS